MSEHLGEWLPRAINQLSASGIESATLEAQVLAAHALGIPRIGVLTHPELVVPPELEALLTRRLSHEPLAYLLGYREFYGRRFEVGPGVLVPRQETEILVETCLRLALPKEARVLDIGSGSGAIAITLKLERPAWDVTALDISRVAASFTRRNADALGALIRVLEGDIFSLDLGHFDLVVSNPPYVGDQDELPADVRDHEPAEALFAGPDGLDFYRRLIPELRQLANFVAFEVGMGQAAAVSEMLREQGFDVQPPVRDYSGIERVVWSRVL